MGASPDTETDHRITSEQPEKGANYWMSFGVGSKRWISAIFMPILLHNKFCLLSEKRGLSHWAAFLAIILTARVNADET